MSRFVAQRGRQRAREPSRGARRGFVVAAPPGTSVAMAAPTMSSSTLPSRLAFALCLAVSSAACTSTVEGSGSGGGDTGAGGGDHSGGGDVGGGDAGEPAADLYACDLPQDCFMDVGHLGEGVTLEAMACVSDAVLSGEHAVMFSTSTPGPYPSEYQGLTVHLGDGTALWQGRSRCLVEDGCDEQNTTEWKLGDLQRCDVVAVDQEPASCGFEEGERCVYDSLENCVVVPAADFTCEAAAKPSPA
jgi:hypothetical protein